MKEITKAVENWLLKGDGAKHKGLNPEQVAAVTSSNNTVTAAGAGAGKTFVLARRYAYLVCVKKLKVSEILTLTFTRKATAEMYSRIYQTLATIANTFSCPHAIQAVADFHSARIQTLDSYCSSILKNSVNHYGIKPDFTIDDQQAKTIATQMALPFVLQHRHHPAIQLMATTTLSRLDNLAEEFFAKTVVNFSTLARPVEFSQEIQNQLAYAATKFCNLSQTITKLVHDLEQMVQGEEKSSSRFVPKLIAAIDFFNKTDFNPSFLLQRTQGNSTKSPLEQTDPLPLLRPEEKQDLIDFSLAVHALAKLQLTGQSKKPWCQPVQEIKNRLYQELNNLANYLCRQKELLQLAQLLEEFQDNYNHSKRQAGILTFSDAALLALETLKTQPSLRQDEKEAYKSIMIDEFQDDNLLQKDLLYILSEKLELQGTGTVAVENLSPGKLFFVGDEKQSIYKFRGADVSVFRGLSKELFERNEAPSSREEASPRDAGGSLTLSYNYRSHPTLIAAFNTIFGGLSYGQDGEKATYPQAIFMEEGEDTPEYEATYREVLAGKITEDESPEDKSRRRVHLCLYKENPEETDSPPLHKNNCEAFFVAKKIRQLVDQGKKPSDIAILFSTYSKQHLYETYLKTFDVPYSAESTVGFFQDAPTNDILSFLTLCLYPANQTAYSTLLRSPLVGISSTGLEILMAHGSTEIFNQEDSFLLPNQQERDAFIQGCKSFHQLASQALTMPIAQLVTKLWYALGYRYKTMEEETSLQYAPLYDKLFHLAVQADTKGTSLAGFVQTLQDQVDNEGKFDDITVPLEREGGVQLMTIHKSKGLEFPIVFVVNTDGKHKTNKNDASTYKHHKWGITINLPAMSQLGGTSKSNFFYDEAKEEENAKDQAELRRVLYVALTRAEEEVYITASPDCFDKDNPASFKEKENPDTMFKLLVPQINKNIGLDSSIQVAKDSPFDAEWIPPVTHQDVEEAKKSLIQRPQPGAISQDEAGPATNHTETSQNSKPKANQLAKALAPCYQGQTIVPAVEESPYRSPSHLAPKSPEYWQQAADEGIIPATPVIPATSGILSGATTNKPQSPQAKTCSEIAQLVESTLKADGIPAFTYADFGTCVHHYLEAALHNREPILATKYLQHLSQSNQKKLHQLCHTMTQQFLASPTGQVVQEAPWKKMEFPFKLKLGKYIINGSVDLIYKDSQGRYHIVDYKTDQEEHPEHYYPQQAAYKKAVATIFNLPEEQVSCSLYYLRTGHLVDISQECSLVNLEELAARAVL